MTRRAISDIFREQEERTARFPSHKIAFQKGDWNVAVDDQREFDRYRHGEISLQTLCKLVKENNHLPYVTEQQMINELKETGWL